MRLVEPDPLSQEFTRYAASNMEHYVFEFLLNYVRRMRSDLNWSKLLKRNPEKPFLLFVTPSDIGMCWHSSRMGWQYGTRLEDYKRILLMVRRKQCHYSPKEKT